MRVLWTPLARQRLTEIEKHIAQDNRQATRRLSLRLVSRSMTLAEAPLLGKRLPQYSSDDVRELLIRPFRLIFRVRGDAVEVLTIMHYRQLLPDDLAELSAGSDIPPH